MRTFKSILCAVVICALPSISYSQLYIEETLFPVYVKSNDEGNGAGGSVVDVFPTESGLGYDFRTTIGYTFTNGVILALTYNLFNVNSSRPSKGGFESVERKLSKSELGPTLGYKLGSWRLLLTYFMTAENSKRSNYHNADGTPATDETYTNHDGKGIQFAINYSLNLGAGFEIGPSLIYRTVEYPKQSYTPHYLGGTAYSKVTLVTPAIDAELKPMITVVYRY